MTLDWLNHRWVRYRATMASLETYPTALRGQYTKAPMDGGPTYEALMGRGPKDPPSSYRLSVEPAKGIDQTAFALETRQDLMNLIADWEGKHHDKNAASFNSGDVPNPRAALRAQPGGQAPARRDAAQSMDDCV